MSRRCCGIPLQLEKPSPPPPQFVSEEVENMNEGEKRN